MNEVEFNPHGPHGSHTEAVAEVEGGAVAVAEVEGGETLLLSEEPLSVCDGVVGVEGVES